MPQNFMKKYLIIALVIILIIFIAYILIKVIPLRVAPNDITCEKNDDCVPVLLECGGCQNHYSAAINKRYSDKYLEIYLNKCKGDNMVCEMIIPGNSKCENNKCVLTP